MNKHLLLLFLITLVSAAKAQVTWSNNIANLGYTNCSNCHNSNGIAPFTLMNYQDAYDNGDDIRDAVVDKKMPPWPPNPNYNHLAHERILTPQQINDITDWVYNGMPRGNSLNEPAAPVFNSQTEIASPDLILSCPQYTVNTTSDLYRCFVIPSSLLTSQFITAFEAVPGDRSIVHHVLVYSDSTNLPNVLDALDPGPGYTWFGGTGSSNSKLIGAWVPGQKAYFAPGNMGIRVPANAKIILQIHYPGGTLNKVDSTKLFLKLSANPLREIYIRSPLDHFHLDQGNLHIPANTIKTFTCSYPITADVSALAVGPHMHLVGKSIRSWAVTGAGDTIPFIDIPDWDFHWQGSFAFRKALKVPAGSTLYSSATYDNTTANEDNPNDPPQDVDFGESTTDEMMLVYFSFTAYQPGDENIVIDSTITTDISSPSNSIVHTLQLYDPTPNPAKNEITFQYFLPMPADVEVSIIDINGKLIKRESPKPVLNGLTTSRVSVSELSTGVYFLTLKADGVVRAKKFLKE